VAVVVVVVVVGHITATAVGLDVFSTEVAFNLIYTGLYGNSATSRNKGILPYRILPQVPDQKILRCQVDQPNSSTVEVSWLDT